MISPCLDEQCIHSGNDRAGHVPSAHLTAAAIKMRLRISSLFGWAHVQYVLYACMLPNMWQAHNGGWHSVALRSITHQPGKQCQEAVDPEVLVKPFLFSEDAQWWN